METAKSDELYSTHDLVTAVFLSCQGHRAQVVPTDEPGRAAFVFRQSDQLDADLAEFARGQGQVPALAYERLKHDLLDRARALLRQGGQP